MRPFIFALITLGAVVAVAAEIDGGWHNLNSVTHDRFYAVLLRDSHCVQGRLLRVSEDELVLRTEPARELVIQRSQVLRVADHWNATSRAFVFSGRSSWSDVKAADPQGSEYLAVVTRQSQRQQWKKPTVSDDSISGEGGTISKTDVRFVYYFRYKPLTQSEEYLEEERFTLFAPRLWFSGAMLGKIAVLLYDSKVPEDNSPVLCKTP